MDRMTHEKLYRGVYARLSGEPARAFDAYLLYRDTLSVDAVCRELGVSPEQVERWRHDFHWDKRVRVYLAELRQRGMALSRERLMAGAVEAVRLLHSVVVDETAPVRERTRCAEMLLTMVGYFNAK
jgi:hypothetical protein